MNPTLLATKEKSNQTTLCIDNIHAIFTKNPDGSYDIILEINSNKFLLTVEKTANQIERLEIIATKGFIEISNKIILVLKKLVEHLRYRLD